jgi:methionyl aminopeptidase
MITLKTKEEIAILKEGGHKLAQILRQLVKATKPGVGSAALEKMALELIAKAGGEPAFKDYDMGNNIFFPSALCVSINNEVVHGPAVPNRVFKSGDLVDLDIGMKWPKGKNGLYTDTCYTVGVGKVSKEAKQLLKVSQKSLELALKQVKPGKTLNDIGKAVEDYVAPYGYGIVRDLVGHGVGYEAHEEPNVFNYEIGHHSPENEVLKTGLVIAIEPMINLGTWKVKVAPNGYTVLTADGSLSAHFEHTVVVTDKGCQIITI